MRKAHVRTHRLWTDASWRDGIAGYGFVLDDLTTGERTHGGDSGYTECSLGAEIVAVAVGLDGLPVKSVVDLRTDSKAVVSLIDQYYRGVGRIRIPRTAEREWELCHEAMRRLWVHPRWVRGHIGQAENEECDRIARQKRGNAGGRSASVWGRCN